MRWTILACTLWLLAATSEAASVHVRLIRAANRSAPADQHLTDIAPKLKPVFGYDHYAQLGSKRAALQGDKTLKLYPGEGFTVFVTPKGHARNTHELEVALYSGKVSVTKATVKIAENNSVFIKGPEVGATLIIVALTVRE